jgi:hypothetical protein
MTSSESRLSFKARLRRRSQFAVEPAARFL